MVKLDEKQESMSKVNISSMKDQRQKFLLDFKNVFENMFLYVKEPGDTLSQGIQLASDNPASAQEQPESDGMSAETKVFIERELMRKDFKYIVDTLKIGFTDVYARIVNGKYDISVRPIETSVGGVRSYRITFAAKYDFTNHAFTDIEIKAYEKQSDNPKPILGGRTIRVANPSSIFIKSFKERFAEM